MTSSLLAVHALKGTGGLGGTLTMILPIILIVGMFFFMSRSQKKQERETNQMRNSVCVGDEITTIGGIVGKIVNIREDNIVIETSSDRTKIKITRRAILSVDKKINEEPTKQEAKPTKFKVKK